jgi:hypothetical protein
MKLYVNTWFGVVSWITTSSGASTVSHYDDEGLDVEELLQSVALDVLLQCRNKGFDNFETLNKASRDLLYEECKGCHKEHTVLWMILKLLKLNGSNECSDSSFSALLELLSKKN